MTYLLTLVLTLGGVAVTIIVAVFLESKRRNRHALAYVGEDCIPLFESIVQSIDGLEITYQKKTIGPTLVLLKGSFINNGNTDIDNASIHEPVRINLPERYKWLQARIIGSSRRVKPKYAIRDKSNLESRWDLLKSGEFFSFNALIKGPKSTDATENLLERISFSQRITNLQRIKRESISGSIKVSVKQLIFRLIPSFLILFMAITVFLVARTIPSRSIRFLIEETNSKVSEVTLTAQSNDTIAIKDMEGELIAEVEPSQLFSKHKFSGSTVTRKTATDWNLFAMELFLLSAASVIATMEYMPWRKERKLVKILKGKQ